MASCGFCDSSSKLEVFDGHDDSDCAVEVRLLTSFKKKENLARVNFKVLSYISRLVSVELMLAVK